MPVRTIPSAIAVLVTLTACGTLPTSPSNDASARTVSASHAVRSTSATVDKNCNGSTVSDVASNWPWAHSEKTDFFAPPPGGMALLIRQQGEELGVASVREYQQDSCG